MKITLRSCLLFGFIAISACVQPVPNIKVRVKLSPPPPVSEPPIPLAPETDMKDLKYFAGDTVLTKGIVYGHKDAGDTTFVYMGAPYPHQQLLVLITGDARKAFVNMDNKSIYVAGCLSKHKGTIEMTVSDSDHFAFNYIYRKVK